MLCSLISLEDLYQCSTNWACPPEEEFRKAYFENSHEFEAKYMSSNNIQITNAGQYGINTLFYSAFLFESEGSQSRQTVKYCHGSRGARNQESLC
jgi:hypothetical protein